MNYTVDYFIEKFEAIPEEKWFNGNFKFGDKYCALGHCGMDDETYTEEGNELLDLFDGYDLSVAGINDRLDPRFLQKTPKQRILAALNFIKEKNLIKEKESAAVPQ